MGSLNPSTSTPLLRRAVRHRLPDERLSITHKFSVGGHEGYLTVGLYKDGMPGEIFITMAKEGSTVSGLMDSFACAVSIGIAARRAAQAAVREVRAHPLRAQRLEPQPGHRLRQVDHGLHLPLAAAALPHRTAAGALRRPASQVRRRPAAGTPDENGYGQKSFGDVIPTDPSNAVIRAERSSSDVSSRAQRSGAEGPAVPGDATDRTRSTPPTR